MYTSPLSKWQRDVAATATHVRSAGPASDWPMPRALHSLTQLGSRFVLLGGHGSLGPLGDVHVLESPPLQRGLALQRTTQATEAALAQSQAHVAQLQGELGCCESRARGAETAAQVRCTHPHVCVCAFECVHTESLGWDAVSVVPSLSGVAQDPVLPAAARPPL